MMVQPAPEGQPRFVTFMREHNAMCRVLVEAFGNAVFERCEPFEPVAYAVSHHDYGWDEADANPEVNPENGFPKGLGNGSVPGIIGTGPLSARFNEDHHSYSGLISSMHITGLYNARYGLSDFEVRIGGSKSVPVADKDRAMLEAMLSGEADRQARLKRHLGACPHTGSWVDEARIWQNYKILQFIDTLSLYFHTRHESTRKAETFTHVPKSATEDVVVTLTPQGGGIHCLDPFPFAGDELSVDCAGRYVHPVDPATSSSELARILSETPKSYQTHRFVRA